MDLKDREALEILENMAKTNKDTHPKIAEAARRGAKAIEIKFKAELLIREYEDYRNG